MSLIHSPHLTFGAVTDTGVRRTHNEDCYRADPDLGLFVVADGVGGQVSGQVASEVAVAAIHDFIVDWRDDDRQAWPFPVDPSLSEAGNRVRAAILLADHALAGQIRENERLRGMAATISVVLIYDHRAVIGNVGDCRAYLFRQQKLAQITRDHTWVAEQVRSGRLEADAAVRHPMRNLVTRAITGDQRVEIDIIEVELAAGDSLLLCSDGLHSTVPDDDIRRTLVEPGIAAEQACHQLVDIANQRGGRDNVTVVLIRVPDPS